MADQDDAKFEEQQIEIDLRNPAAAAFWAWVWPGAGHIYQRRYAKAVLFMVCILSIYFFGLAMSGGHVVYASWKGTNSGPVGRAGTTLRFICQLGVGLPATPAIIQRVRVDNGKEPLFADVMAPPDRPGEPLDPGGPDRLADWHQEYHSYFELGTLYTVIAGLLNILAIYDAYAGPMVTSPDKEKKKDGDKPPPEE